MAERVADPAARSTTLAIGRMLYGGDGAVEELVPRAEIRPSRDTLTGESAFAKATRAQLLDTVDLYNQLHTHWGRWAAP